MCGSTKKKIIAFICAFLCTLEIAAGCAHTTQAPEEAAADVSNQAGYITSPAAAESSESELCSFSTEEVFGESEGDRIFGVMYIPEDEKETHPALIIAHGYGGSYRDGVNYAEMLAQRGWVAYCFDFRGGSTSSQSEGSTLEMSFFTEQRDLEEVLAMMQAQSYVDPDNIFLMGISQGGAVSAMTAAEHADEVRGMALFFPAFNLVDEITDMFDSPESIPDTFDFLWMEVGRPYGDIWGYDIYDSISAYGNDVLLLHGDADSIVPISYSEKAREVYPSADLVIIPGADHGFYGEDSNKAFEFMLEYMNDHVVS